MKRKLPLFVLLTIVFATISSCKKYPDGPAVSLRSKKERMANTWHLQSYYENGVDKTAEFNSIFKNVSLMIDKNCGYSLYYFLVGSFGYGYSENGSWRFTNNETYFETTPQSSSPGSVASHRILRLKEKELWYEDTEGSGIVKTYHLIP